MNRKLKLSSNVRQTTLSAYMCKGSESDSESDGCIEGDLTPPPMVEVSNDEVQPPLEPLSNTKAKPRGKGKGKKNDDDDEDETDYVVPEEGATTYVDKSGITRDAKTGIEIMSDDESDAGSLDEFLADEEEEEDEDEECCASSDDSCFDDDDTTGDDGYTTTGDDDDEASNNGNEDAQKVTFNEDRAELEMRKKRRLEKDLDGIDTNNIITEGSRRTRKRTQRYEETEEYIQAAKKTVYKNKDVEGLSSDEEESADVTPLREKEDSDDDWHESEDDDE